MPTTIAPLHTPEQINANVDRIRTAYIRNRKHFISSVSGEYSSYGDKGLNKWDGKKTPHGVQYKPVWPEIANNVSDITDDYEGYIHAQFFRIAAITNKIEPPQPNQLGCNAARNNYKNHVSQAEQYYKNKLKSETNLFESEYQRINDWYEVADDEAAWNLVLANTGNGLSPLFRFCVAYSEELLSRRIFQAASLNQLLLDPTSYQHYWKDVLPEHFMQTVPELLKLELKFLELENR